MVKVKAVSPIFENGRYIERGEVFEVSEERARQLKSYVVVMKEKQVEKAKKDKMVKKAKNKGVK